MNKSNSNSSVLLMELIVVILFFAICVSISIQAFVSADNMSKSASNLNHAVIRAESLAEKISDTEGIQNYYWDGDWTVVNTAQDAQFTAVVKTASPVDHMSNSTIVIYDNGKELYDLEISNYIKPNDLYK